MRNSWPERRGAEAQPGQFQAGPAQGSGLQRRGLPGRASRVDGHILSRRPDAAPDRIGIGDAEIARCQDAESAERRADRRSPDLSVLPGDRRWRFNPVSGPIRHDPSARLARRRGSPRSRPCSGSRPRSASGPGCRRGSPGRTGRPGSCTGRRSRPRSARPARRPRWTRRAQGTLFGALNGTSDSSIRPSVPTTWTTWSGVDGHRAGEGGRAAVAEVEDRRGHPVDPPVGVDLDVGQDPRRLGVEQPSRERDRVAADVHQAAAALGRVVADVARVVVEEREERLDRPEPADPAGPDQLLRRPPLGMVAVHEGFHQLELRDAGPRRRPASAPRRPRGRSASRRGRACPPPAPGSTRGRAGRWAAGCRWRRPRGRPAAPRTSRGPGRSRACRPPRGPWPRTGRRWRRPRSASPFCMAGMTFSTPILAVLRMPQRILLHGQRMTPSSTLITCEAQRSLPKVLKSWKVQTTFLSRVTSMSCGLLGAGVGVAEDQVAVGPELERGDPGQLDPGQLVVVDAPDDLALGVDLDDPVVVPAGDQGVAVGQADGVEDLGPVPVVAGRGGPAGEVELVAPDDLAGVVVLADGPVQLVADQVMAVGQLPGPAGVAVRVRAGRRPGGSP